MQEGKEIEKQIQEKRKEFDKLCQSIEQNYLQNKHNLKIITNNQSFLNDSKIVEKEQERQMMNKWVYQSFDKKQNLKSQLIFRASEHNFSASQFHKKCDGKKDTLVIVKNEFDKIIGGFTQQEWSSKGGYVKDVNNKAFMFSLTLKQKYKCIQPQNSILVNLNYGPIFGNGHQLVINNKCNQNKLSNSNFGKSYNLKVDDEYKYEYGDQQTKYKITGNPNGNQFKVKQYEVYQIK